MSTSPDALKAEHVESWKSRGIYAEWQQLIKLCSGLWGSVGLTCLQKGSTRRTGDMGGCHKLHKYTPRAWEWEICATSCVKIRQHEEWARVYIHEEVISGFKGDCPRTAGILQQTPETSQRSRSQSQLQHHRQKNRREGLSKGQTGPGSWSSSVNSGKPESPEKT